MKRNNWKFFVGIGVLLIIAGILLLPDDSLIGIIGILVGGSNVFKGIRLYKGIQPMIIRKQQERDRQIDQELNSEIDAHTKEHDE